MNAGFVIGAVGFAMREHARFARGISMSAQTVGSAAFTYVATRIRGDRYGRTALRTTYGPEFAEAWVVANNFNDDVEVVTVSSPAEYPFRAPYDENTQSIDPDFRHEPELKYELLAMAHADLRALLEAAELDGCSRLEPESLALIAEIQRMANRLSELATAEIELREDRLPSPRYCWCRLLCDAKEGRNKSADSSKKKARRIVKRLVKDLGGLDDDAADGIVGLVRNIKTGEHGGARMMKRVAKLD